VRLVVSPGIAETIRHLSPSIKRGIEQALRLIAAEPGCGEPLQRELAEYLKYKVRRFRIIYAVDRTRRVIRVVAVGPRATIYEEFAARLREPDGSPENP